MIIGAHEEAQSDPVAVVKRFYRLFVIYETAIERGLECFRDAHLRICPPPCSFVSRAIDS